MGRVFVCDDCITAAYDAGARNFRVQVALCIAAGDTLGDHECSDRTVCHCACRPNAVEEASEYRRKCVETQEGFDG